MTSVKILENELKPILVENSSSFDNLIGEKFRVLGVWHHILNEGKYPFKDVSLLVYDLNNKCPRAFPLIFLRNKRNFFINGHFVNYEFKIEGQINSSTKDLWDKDIIFQKTSFPDCPIPIYYFTLAED